MIITVRLFARARDFAGADHLDVDLASGARIEELRDRLATSCPALAPLLRNSAISVNEEFADDETVLSEGCKVAVIPPVSGG
jgi:molybdopterin converting factor subunit 1